MRHIGHAQISSAWIDMLRPTRLSYQTNKHVMEELKDLDQIMIQEVGLDVTVNCSLWLYAGIVM